MKKIKFIAATIVTLGLFAGIIVGSCLGSGLTVTLCGLIIPFTAGFAERFGYDLFTKGWKSSFRSKKADSLILKDTKVRISFAYLYRIRLSDGKYLLIKNNNTKLFQAIGGCYKMNKDELFELKRKFSVCENNGMPLNDKSKLDYRLLVPQNELKRFVRRFERKDNHESLESLTREFREEMLDTGYLDKELFSKITYRYCGRHYDGINFSHFLGYYELLIADILEIEFTPDQLNSIENLAAKNLDSFLVTNEKLIETQGVDKENKKYDLIIANNVYKILESEECNLSKNKKCIVYKDVSVY